MALRLQEPFHLDCGHAAGSGSGDGLAVSTVLNVTGVKHRFYIGARAAMRDDVSVLIEINLPNKRRGVGDVANGDEESMDIAFFEITSALRRSHRLRPDQQADFQIRNQADFLAVLSESAQTFTLLLAGIAAVSLLVGGIGIMNIMLVSVTERTREIGIRLAVGAHGSEIQLQFLTEAVVLSAFGGTLGILLGIGTSELLSYFNHWPTLVSPLVVLVAFLGSAGVGMVSGFYPARKASLLDPIDALRYE